MRRQGTTIAAAVLAAGTLAVPMRSGGARAPHAPIDAAARGMPRAAPPVAVPVLVELFTSEGCSSCPPADALLADLVERQPVPGAIVIGLGEHVDYWDQLGWVDPFSKAKFTSRQDAYAQTLRSSDVYTPQMVVDGQDAFVGSDRPHATAAIAAQAARPMLPIAMAWSGAAEDRLTVDLPANPAAANATIYVAVAEDRLVSRVTAGENRGRTLEHSSVVRRLDAIGRADRTGAFRQDVPVRLDGAWTRANLQVVAFAQRAGTGPVAAIGRTSIRSSPPR